MKNEDVYSEIFEHFSTKKDLSEFLSQLNSLERQFFNNKVSVSDKLEEIFSHELESSLRSATEKKKVNIEDSSEFRDFIKELTEYTQKMPVVTLRLAFEPTQKQLLEIEKWFESEIDKHVVFDVVFDESVIGGAVIEYKGKHYDFSVRKKISSLSLGNS